MLFSLVPEETKGSYYFTQNDDRFFLDYSRLTKLYKKSPPQIVEMFRNGEISEQDCLLYEVKDISKEQVEKCNASKQILLHMHKEVKDIIQRLGKSLIDTCEKLE